MADNDPNAIDGDEDGGGRRPKTVMTAKEALDKIRQGVAIEGVRIERLAFKGVWGEKDKPIRFKNCHLVRPRFDDGVVFEGSVEMVSCTVEKPHFGKKVEFKAHWNLENSVLISWTMGQVTVLGKFNLTSATTKGTTGITNCNFLGGIRFWEATFQAWMNFKKCEFAGEIDMRSFVAQAGIVFAACKFNTDVLLRGASVAMKFDLSGSRFEGVLDFRKAKLNDYWYLEDIEMGEKCRLTFENAVGDKLLLKPSQVEGRLQSEGAGDHLRAMKEYAFLKRCYAEQHRYDDEDWAFHKFKVMQRRGANRSWYRPWTKVTQFLDWLFLDLGCGYCTNPYRAVRTALIVILLFAGIYAWDIDEFYPESLKAPMGGSIFDLGNRCLLGLMTSVSLFTSGAQGISLLAGGYLVVPIMLEAILGLKVIR
jgi:hypothetical protein